jgi:YHS domain-containing protein
MNLVDIGRIVVAERRRFNKTSGMIKLASFLAAAVLLAGCASSSSTKTASLAPGVKPYPLKTCIVMDDELDKDATSFVYEGQELKICCDGCKEDFEKEPAKYLKKLAGK